MRENKEKKNHFSAFKSIEMLQERWRNGTFHEILEDWQWIFGYSKKYKGAILFYLLLGIISSSMGYGKQCGKQIFDRYCDGVSDGKAGHIDCGYFGKRCF